MHVQISNPVLIVRCLVLIISLFCSEMFAPFVLLSSFQSMVALSPSSSKLSSIYCPKKLNALSSIISSERWRLDTTIAAMAKDIGVLVLKVQTGYQSGGYLLILISLSLLQVFSIFFFFG